MENDHYQTLGLSDSATMQEIKSAYRSLVRLHHPDANPDKREECEVLMKAVLTAYSTLSDPTRRSAYDTELKLRAYEALQNGGNVRVTHHAPTQSAPVGLPASLVGKVRSALGHSTDEFSAKLGISETILAGFESRDAIPQSPLQMRTFAHFVEEAAQKLEKDGKSSDAIDIRTAFSRKKANRNFMR
jgi:curved DNA-binding protein CbpA